MASKGPIIHGSGARSALKSARSHRKLRARSKSDRASSETKSVTLEASLHFPMQKRVKIWPSRSSAVNSPVIESSFALRKTKFFCKEFALRHRLPGSLKRLGDVLEGDEVPLARHEHIFSTRLPAGEREQRAAQRVDALAGPGRT